MSIYIYIYLYIFLYIQGAHGIDTQIDANFLRVEFIQTVEISLIQIRVLSESYKLINLPCKRKIAQERMRNPLKKSPRENPRNYSPHFSLSPGRERRYLIFEDFFKLHTTTIYYTQHGVPN